MIAGHPGVTRAFFGLLHMIFLRAWYVRRELKRQIQARSGANTIRVLDAGTGFGQFSYWIARRFPSVRITAVDIKQEYLDRASILFAKANLAERVEFSIDDLTALAAQGPFDLILSVDVMEHIEQDETVFRHFARVLAPGGAVIINTPSDQGGSDVQISSEDSFIGEHVRDGYNRVDLVEKLRRAGLETSHALYTYGRPGSMAWRLLVKVPMLLLGFNWVLVILLPVYYLPILPLGLLLNWMDMRRPNEIGTGLLVVAEKARFIDTASSGSPGNAVF